MGTLGGSEDYSPRVLMHRAVDQICAAVDQARLDARARPYPSSGGGTGSSRGCHADPTYGATLRANVADVWLAKLARLQHDLYHEADMALKHWPRRPASGETVDGVTVGQRGSTVELCALCRQPAPSGRDENGRLLIHRVPLGNGTVVLHATSCYYRLDRQARAAGATIATWLSANAQTV